MSIPEGRTSYFGRYEDKEKFRLINQHGVRIVLDPGKTGYPGSWDMNVSPYDGTVYIAMCHEGQSEQARLVAYDYAKDESKIVVKAEKLTLPPVRQLPHTKFHEAIDFLPDGRLIATTHSTDKAPQHPEWMPFAHVDHVYDGFPGSAIVIYDPKTGESRNMGVPAPRESIYGACYDAKHNAYYMIGFMRGHVYRYSLDDCTVRDLGKAAEVYCYRLHRGPDAHIYGMTKTGFLFRINVDTEEIEDMHWRMPAFPDNFVDNTWYRYLSQAHNVSDHEFVFTSTASEDMFLFDTDTCTVRDLGKRAPVDYVNDFEINPFCLDEFCVDKYGVLWYALSGWMIDKPKDEFYRTPNPRLLVRWDFRNEPKPEILGIMGTQEHNYSGSSVLCLDKERDIFYCIGSSQPINQEGAASSCALFCLNLAEFRPHAKEKGPIWEQKMTVKPYPEEEVAEIRKKAAEPPEWAGEEVSGKNPFAPVPISHVIPIRLWRKLADTPGARIEDSKVRGLAWDGEGNIHGYCGETENRYYFRLSPRKTAWFASKAEADACEDVMIWRSILKTRINEREENGRWAIDVPLSYSYEIAAFCPVDDITVGLAKWLDENLLPGKCELPEGTVLPEVAGRRYLAVATATAELAGGRIAVGTKDGLFATVKDGKVFNYGNAAPLGPVRCMSVTPDGKRLYGTAGDVEDMGTIFAFDDEHGLRQLGLINYNSPGYMDGPTASNVLSAIAVSPDGTMLAVGGADRIGAVHILML